MGQVLSNIIQCLCGEAEDDLERLSHNLLLPSPTPTSQNESNTNSGALLQTALCSSPSSDSCSDLSTSGSSVHLSSLDSHGDSTTSSALHHNSHGDLGTACVLQQELLISSESLESLGDSSTRGLLQLPMVFYSSTDILSNSSTYVPTLDPPLGVDSNIEVVGKKRHLAIPPLSDIHSIEPSGKERERASKGVMIKERWIKHYSSHQNILCGEAEDDKERLSHNLLLPPPTPTSQINESNTNSGALLQTALSSSPSPDSCSDLSTSGSSVHSDSSTSGSSIHLSILDSRGDSTTSSALHQNSHGHLGPACASQQEILISSETLESLSDSSTSGLLQLPMVFYSSKNILSNSSTYVPTFDPPLGIDSNIKVVGKKRQLAIPPLSRIHSIEPNGKERERANKGVVIKERWIKHYNSHQNILLVGEGDFSFSACLALAFGSANNMIATSLNSEGFLRTNYRNARSNIQKLRSRGCKVMHGVDATKMANDLLFEDMEFDCIIYNFPHSGFLENESRKSALGRHRELVRQFLANAKKMITEKGEIHISHKSNSFFLEWNVEFLASQEGLGLIESVDFNLNDYPGYRTKYGFGGDKNFNCKPSKTYKFGLKKQPKV